MATIFYGPVLHALNYHTLQILPRALLAVASGRIEWLIDNVPPSESGATIREAAASKGWRVGERKAGDPPDRQHAQLRTLQDGEFIIPGFIDTHTVCVYIP